jgi:hypothetical protein
MMKLGLLTISLITFLLLSASYSQAMDGCWGGRHPHGNYCEGSEGGWYGERKEVRTLAEAKRVLLRYFSSYDDIRINNIKERKWFFEAEIRDKKNKLIDIVIVDKRTGRIRSIY